MNCATPDTEERNNCELVPFMKDSRKWLAAKVTATNVQNGEQLFTRYGGRKVVSTDYFARECPPDLIHTIQAGIELSPYTATGLVNMEYYDYQHDRLWELNTEPQGSRLEKRKLRA